jgi:hypothetical protein
MTLVLATVKTIEADDGILVATPLAGPKAPTEDLLNGLFDLSPTSSRRMLTLLELSGLTKWELRLARNEIFARKGRRMKDKKLEIS